MKKTTILMILCSTLIFASNTKQNNNKKENLTQKQVKEQMKREEKYAKEQKFYNAEDYDFSGAEVNPESVKNTPSLKTDDLDMDDVYD
jgi:sortase (surface protein transpeptidase)